MSYQQYRFMSVHWENVKEKLSDDAENNTASTGSNSAGDDVLEEKNVV